MASLLSDFGGIVIGTGVLLIVIAILIIAANLFWILMLIDAIKRPMDDSQRIAWVLVILFLHLAGASVYYFAVKRPSKT